MYGNHALSSPPHPPRPTPQAVCRANQMKTETREIQCSILSTPRNMEKKDIFSSAGRVCDSLTFNPPLAQDWLHLASWFGLHTLCTGARYTLYTEHLNETGFGAFCIAVSVC